MQSEFKVTEVRVSKLAANIGGLLLTVLFCALGIAFVRMSPRYIEFAEGQTFALAVSCLLLAPVHELLHAVGLIHFAGVPWRHIRFGMMWRALIPYCHCTVPIPLRAYRRMALLPLWVTGTIMIASLALYPAFWLGLFAGIAVAACVGDVWIVAKLRRFAEDLYVQDSPTEIGCDVYSRLQ